MQRMAVRVCWVFFIFLWTLSCAGCSLIGFGLGAMQDVTEQGRALVLPEGIDSVSPGSEVRIRLKDHTLLHERYVSKGWDSVEFAEKEYPERFEQWLVGAGEEFAPLPHLGMKVTVAAKTLRGTERYGGTFTGFDRGVIRIASSVQAQLYRIKLEFVEEVSDSAGRLLAGRELLMRAVETGVPLATSKKRVPCIIIGEKKQSLIPIEEIEAVYVLESGNAKWTGLAIGACVDALVVAISVATFYLGGGW